MPLAGVGVCGVVRFGLLVGDEDWLFRVRVKEEVVGCRNNGGLRASAPAWKGQGESRAVVAGRDIPGAPLRGVECLRIDYLLRPSCFHGW